MKRIIKISATLMLIVLLGTSCSAQLANFQGTWATKNTNDYEFVLTLNQNNSVLKGSHSSVFINGNKLDSSFDDEDITINGNVITKNDVIVTFKSSFSNTSGTAKIVKINSTQITWKIITYPKGEYYFPIDAILYKK